MTYYKDNTLFKRKDNRLHIYKRKDKKSENWYARTFIDKKQIQNGVSATDIAKNLDTSTEMIDKFYTANVQTDELIDRLTRINRSQIKIAS